MLRAHHLIDQIRHGFRRATAYHYDYASDSFSAEDYREKVLAPLADEMARANKFDCSMIRSDEALSSLFETALDYQKHGLLRLPYPQAYFEFCLSEGVILAALAIEVENHNFVVHGWLRQAGEREFLDLGMISYCDSDTGDTVVKPFFLKGAYADQDSAVAVIRTAWSCVAVAIALLSAKGASSIVEEPSAALNKARERKGLCPLFRHTVVKVEAYSQTGRPIRLGGTHASPALHWRRGHVRDLRSGKKAPVKPCLVGKPEFGVIRHDYELHHGK